MRSHVPRIRRSSRLQGDASDGSAPHTGMRNPDGTKKLLMVDFFDSHHYILKRHSVRRKENYEAEGFDVRDCISIGEIFDGGSD